MIEWRTHGRTRSSGCVVDSPAADDRALPPAGFCARLVIQEDLRLTFASTAALVSAASSSLGLDGAMLGASDGAALGACVGTSDVSDSATLGGALSTGVTLGASEDVSDGETLDASDGAAAGTFDSS
jgi:hypothetical protein